MLRTFLAVCLVAFVPSLALAGPETPSSTQTLLLSGLDKDHTVDWDFFCTSGRRSGTWTKIAVPSCWEMKGFGSYTYGFNLRPNEKGLYRRAFTPPANWQDRVVELVFDGVMTDAEVKINGQSAGPVHQGAFYCFRYDVSAALKYGKPNLIEVTVSKDSANVSVNKAERLSDYWIFGGIFRPVYLESRPRQHIERVALDARADGNFAAEVHLENLAGADTLVGQIRKQDGTPVGAAFTRPVQAGATNETLATKVSDPLLWTAETPNLYQVEISLRQGGTEIHRTNETFGFRTIEVRPGDGVYLNGKKIIFKGAPRHCFWPDSGRTTSAEISKADILLMKEMNMNTVLTAHYPPDRHFLEMADALGLYVFDELGGWQKAYDTEVGGKLQQEMIAHDVNHPAIVFWCNGNEGGWNTALDARFAELDPQQRKVLHPWASFSDIATNHYRTYAETEKILESGTIFMPTEFLHGLYDGGAGAGLDDYWRLITGRPNGAGGLIWAFLDEGVVRTDKGGKVDVAGNAAPDGIVGPFREKEGSFFTVRDVWSPIQIAQPDPQSEILPPTFTGQVEIRNHYDFTDASQCRFTWQLINFRAPAEAETGHRVMAEGASRPVAIAPGGSGPLDLGLPDGWRDFDALALSASDPTGREVDRWVWRTGGAEKIARRIVTTDDSPVTASETANQIVLQSRQTRVTLSKLTGRLADVTVGGTAFPLSDGPALATGTAILTGVSLKKDKSSWVVEANYTGDLSSIRWRLDGSGWLQLDYDYRLAADSNFSGVNFSFPEARVSGAKWLGRGPYRVWKNRLRGVATDVWAKKYNDTATGASLWKYPEFKGYHAATAWASLQTRSGEIVMVTSQEGMFLRLFTPAFGPAPLLATAPFPAGDLSFLEGIAPMGNKFHRADQTGPEGQLNPASGDQHRTLFFHFSPAPRR